MEKDFGPQVAAMHAAHFAQFAAVSPPESMHALHFGQLRAPDITLWTLWSEAPEGREAALMGMGALKALDARFGSGGGAADHGEIKSMRTAQDWRGRRVGSVILAAIMDEARARRYRRLSLETGPEEIFAPARRFYARHGFVTCGPFADYLDDRHSVFMTRELA